MRAVIFAAIVHVCRCAESLETGGKIFAYPVVADVCFATVGGGFDDDGKRGSRNRGRGWNGRGRQGRGWNGWGRQDRGKNSRG